MSLPTEEQPCLFDWTAPKGRHTCKRDPAAGPGTCWHWWAGCPNAKKRGCYFLSETWQARVAAEEASDREAARKKAARR